MAMACRHATALVWKGAFDGGSRGNPGVAGAGWWLRDSVGSLVACGTVDCGDNATNNDAEYQGLLALLRFVRDSGQVPPDVALEVQGDSKLVVEQLKFEKGVKGVGWRCNVPRLQELLAEVRATRNALRNEVHVYHVRREFNKDADALSDHAIHTRLTVTAVTGAALLAAARDGLGKAAGGSAAAAATAGGGNVKRSAAGGSKDSSAAKRATALLAPAAASSLPLDRARRVRIRPGVPFDVWIGHDFFENGYELPAAGWGNPIPSGNGCRRATVKDAARRVHAYRAWLTKQASGRAVLQRLANGELRDKVLGCFCELNVPCHGDVLLELGNRPDVARAMLDAAASDGVVPDCV